MEICVRSRKRMKELAYTLCTLLFLISIASCKETKHSPSKPNEQESNLAKKGGSTVLKTVAKEANADENLKLSLPERELDLSLLDQNNSNKHSERDYFAEQESKNKKLSVDAKPNFTAPESIGDLPGLDGGNIEVKLELE